MQARSRGSTSITRLAIREFMAEGSRSKGLVTSHARPPAWRRCEAFFDYLVREEGLASNPARSVEARRRYPKKLPAVMTAEQTNRLVDAGAVQDRERDRFRGQGGAGPSHLRAAVR